MLNNTIFNFDEVKRKDNGRKDLE